MSPLFATLASSSLLLFHGLLTSLLSASNPVKSLACYSDTFLLTLLLQLSLNSTFLLSAQSLNTGVSSGTLLLLPSLNPLTLSNTLLLKLLPNSALRSFLLYYLTFNLPSLTSRRQKAKLIFLFKLLHHYIYFPSQISHPTLPPSYPLRSFHASNLISPFIRKSSFYNSYLPSTIRLWNSLPPTLKETNSLSLFISLLSI